MPPPPSPTARQLISWSAVAVELVAEAAVLAQRRARRPIRTHRKGEGDFVTDVDLAIEALVTKRLARRFPEHGFLGEETDPRRLDAEFVWVLDPIDGTSNFAKGLPNYAIALACLQSRQPIVAAMYVSPDCAIYRAIRGGGARGPRSRLRIAPGKLNDASIVGLQWPRAAGLRPPLTQLTRIGARMRNLGSSVLQLCCVANGQLDANVQAMGHIWDLAAPGLLIEEAGGRLADWSGKPILPFASLDPERHFPSVAGHPSLVRALVRQLSVSAP